MTGISKAHPRNAGDVHIYRRRRRNVAIGSAGGLQALEFVQRFVEAALYGGLVPGELRECVGLIGVPDEGPPECGGLVLLLAPHSADPREGFLVPLFVGYGDIRGSYKEASTIRSYPWASRSTRSASSS